MASSAPWPDSSESDAPKAPEQWSSLLCPYIEQALMSTRFYTTEQISSHLAFFSTYMSVWLGPSPKASSTLSPEGKSKLS